MSAAVEFRGVSHTYRSRGKQVHALRDVSFSLSEGEVFGFVGPNGAGKSTTIKIMLDIINNYQGHVTIYSVEAHRAEARRALAYVPEAPALYEQFTPLEILRMGLSAHGAKRNDIDAWCMQWLERFSIAEYAKRRICQLSKGNAQRTALAHAMAIQPKLLILDEPLSGLDPVGRQDVVDILNEYKEQGGAIFFTSHVLHDVERIADRFGFINKGQLLTVRSPRELAAERADCFILRYQADEPVLPESRMTRAGEYECELTQANLPAAVAHLSATGHHLLGVKPAVSLETLFFRILEGAAGSQAEQPTLA